MVASVPIVKCVFGGRVGTTDLWSTSLALKVTGGVPAAADMNGIAHAAALLFASDFWDKATTGMKQLTPATTSWNTINTYYYPAGSIVSTVSGTFALTADPGVTVAQAAPPQCAVVLSLETGFTGRANRGRNYLPCPSVQSNGGRLVAGTVTALSVNWAALIHDLNAMTVGSLSFNACIGTGACPSITAVSVDDVVDTQRRRRDKQVALTKVITSV